MEKFFKLEENGTKVSTEVMAGLTTFFYHGVYYRGESECAEPVRHGVGRCLSGDDHCFHHRNAGHGAVLPMYLTRWRRVWTECVLCVYGMFWTGIFLAAGAVHGLYLRCH